MIVARAGCRSRPTEPKVAGKCDLAGCVLARYILIRSYSPQKLSTLTIRGN
jgi:hypothetical protein|tara:strand:- start:3495 stop:3647 length:153 start_codon:yes stop_codon:yes gene_type:complete